MHKLIIFLVFFSTCFQISTQEKQYLESDKILIVYLSRTNNTKAIAEIINQKVGGDLVALELENPYPEDYKAIVKQVAEENESGFLPPLRTNVPLEKYETVFLGFPTWGMRLPPPIKSFLSMSDLSDKIVIPFNTNGGYGIGSSFQTVKVLCPNSEVLKGFSIKGGSERDGIFLAIKDDKKNEAEQQIENWLVKIKWLKNKD